MTDQISVSLTPVNITGSFHEAIVISVDGHQTVVQGEPQIPPATVGLITSIGSLISGAQAYGYPFGSIVTQVQDVQPGSPDAPFKTVLIQGPNLNDLKGIIEYNAGVINASNLSIYQFHAELRTAGRWLHPC